MSARTGNGREFSQSGGGRPIWLVTFADLVALLIAFFVMMFATQRVDTGKWESLIEALSRRLNPEQTIVIARPKADLNADRLSRERAIDLDYLLVVIRDKMKLEPELAGLEVRRHADRLSIALPAELLFDSGSSDVKTAARPILFTLAGMLGTIGNRIEVIGHTDPTPVGNSRFASNWELSISRAVTVVNELRRGGYDRALAPSGYGETKFRELPATLPAARRAILARRVDIVIWPTRGVR